MTNEVKILELLTRIEGRLRKVENQFTNQGEQLIEMKTQLCENTQIVKAIRHNQEMSNAKLEFLETTTAKSSALISLDSKFEVLNKRLFDQEVEIQALKLVK